MEHRELDELNDAPRLRSIPATDPFVVPEGFFDSFPHQVQQRVRSAGSGNGNMWARLSAALWPRIALASLGVLAMVALVRLAWPESAAGPAPDLAHVEPEEWFATEGDADLVFAAMHDENDPMASVALPDDDTEVLAYLENEDLPLDLLIEEL